MPEASIYCSRCGTQNSAAAQYCQKCGSAIAPAPAPGAAIVPVATAVPALPVATAVAPVVAYVPPPAVAARPPYGGFWLRAVAYLVDNVILGILFTPIFLIFLLPAVLKTINQINAEEPPTELFGAILLMVPFLWIIQWLYEALTTSSSWQGTVGKRVLRLKVTDEAGNRISFARATGRFFGKILSRLIMDIGFIMVAFTERKQGLHDLLAGTYVVRY